MNVTKAQKEWADKRFNELVKQIEKAGVLPQLTQLLEIERSPWNAYLEWQKSL